MYINKKNNNMPRGIPSTGLRNSGGGRKKKYASEVVQKWIPTSISNKLDDIYVFLIDLEKEVTAWEQKCNEKNTSPRYEQAIKLVSELRTLLDRLSIDVNNIYADNRSDD